MQPFSLTRDDYADLQKRILANAKAQLGKAPGGSKGWWVPWALWCACVVPFIFFFRWLQSLPSMGSHLAVGAGGMALTVVVFWWLFVYGTKALQGAMYADNGYCLAPQSLDVRADCIEQRSEAAFTCWQWSGFMQRQESETLVFLFVDNAVCLPIPKAILTPEAYALIEQRVPLVKS